MLYVCQFGILVAEWTKKLQRAKVQISYFINKNREVDKQLYMPQVGIGIVLILAFIGIMNYMNTNVIYFKPDNYCG